MPVVPSVQLETSAITEPVSQGEPVTPAGTGLYRDQATGIQVMLSGDDRTKGLHLIVHPKEKPEVTLDHRLADLELDLYDIYFVDTANQRQQITSSAQVILPVRGQVEGVYYIAPTGLSEALPFTQIDANHVAVEVTHFSYYGVAYRKGGEQGESATGDVAVQTTATGAGSVAPVAPVASVAAATPVATAQPAPAAQTSLPATGDGDSVFVYAAGSLSLMAGLGLVYASKKKLSDDKS